ncbi:MAG TPA: hypothetical protein VNW92_04605 [Polyangiaceae bacterium]|nr:hypothetical protein [Polyangiaceae bacterium]
MKEVIRGTVLTLVMCCWTVCAHAEPAGSDTRAVAEGLTKSGISAFERHDYPAALAFLKRASVLAPGPVVGLYAARSHVALGQLVEAAEDYRGAVDSTDDSPALVHVVEHARDELAQLRPRIPLVEFALGDAELRSHNLRLVVDGKLVSPGAPAQVDPGHHEVVASDADGEKTRLAFEVGEGESKTMALSWRSEAGHGGKEPLADASSSSARHTLGVVALGVGATGLGVGTVTGIAALSRLSAAEQHCPAGKCVEGEPVPDDGSAFRALRTISAAGYVVGAAGIGTWLGLLLTTPTPNVTTERPKVSPWTPVVGMGSAGARYVF